MSGGDLNANLRKWLEKEGYPLEYYTAHVFRSNGLHVRQGMYSRSDAASKPREIDVTAEANFVQDDLFVRIETIVECKWSGDKPLVIFTAEQAQLAPTACIAHTIASDTCDAALWLLRNNERIQETMIFKTPEVPGVGGRQAFGSTDRFYNAMLSVTAACAEAVRAADKGYEKSNFVQYYGLIALPLIVVDGAIFEARYDKATGDLATVEVQHTRCHWRGSPDWPLITTIDVVSRSHLDNFAKARLADCKLIGPLVLDVLIELRQSFKDKSTTILRGKRGPSGRGGGPRLLQALSKLAEVERGNYTDAGAKVATDTAGPN